MELTNSRTSAEFEDVTSPFDVGFPGFAFFAGRMKRQTRRVVNDGGTVLCRPPHIDRIKPEVRLRNVPFHHHRPRKRLSQFRVPRTQRPFDSLTSRLFSVRPNDHRDRDITQQQITKQVVTEQPGRPG